MLSAIARVRIMVGALATGGDTAMPSQAAMPWAVRIENRIITSTANEVVRAVVMRRLPRHMKTAIHSMASAKAIGTSVVRSWIELSRNALLLISLPIRRISTAS